jgi:hypothetical protein
VTRSDLHRYRRLLRYAGTYRQGWALIGVVSLLSTAFALLQPVLGHAPMPASLARAVGLLPGGATSNGMVAWVALAGLLVFAFNSAVDVYLTRAWIRIGQAAVARFPQPEFGG